MTPTLESGRCAVVATPWYLRNVPKPVERALFLLLSPVLLPVLGAVLAIAAWLVVAPGMGVTIALFPSVIDRGWHWWHVLLAAISGMALWFVLGTCLFRLARWSLFPPRRVEELEAAMDRCGVAREG